MKHLACEPNSSRKAPSSHMIPTRIQSRERKVCAEELRIYALVEQYKALRASITDVVQDRNSNNNFLLAICTAVFGAQAYILRSAIDNSVWPLPPSTLFLVTSSLSGVGIILSWIWIQLSASYDKGLSIRYDSLRDIERHLPAQPFTSEKSARKEAKYRSLESATFSYPTASVAAHRSSGGL